MKAFHGDKKIKAFYLKRVRQHAKADEIIKGKYWENGKGCAVGCTIHSGDHRSYESELGIPQWLARVEDRLFEGMPHENAMKWPEKFLSAIPVGVDLEQVKAPFMIFILQSTLETFDHDKYPAVLESINSVIDLYIMGGTTEDFIEARRAYAAADDAAAAAYAAAAAAAAYAAADDAAAAAYAAADDAADAAAAYAADAAAYAAAADDAAAAAYAAADDAADAAAADAYLKFSEKLIELLKACK